MHNMASVHDGSIAPSGLNMGFVVTEPAPERVPSYWRLLSILTWKGGRIMMAPFAYIKPLLR